MHTLHKQFGAMVGMWSGHQTCSSHMELWSGWWDGHATIEEWNFTLKIDGKFTCMFFFVFFLLTSGKEFIKAIASYISLMPQHACVLSLVSELVHVHFADSLEWQGTHLYMQCVQNNMPVHQDGQYKHACICCQSFYWQSWWTGRCWYDWNEDDMHGMGKKGSMATKERDR